jgi:hypothetical protein
MEFITIQPQQKQTLRIQGRWWPRLAARLEPIGGTKIVIPLWPEQHLHDLVWNGVSFNADHIDFKLGETSGCHRNVSRLYLAGDVAAIATGYGLTVDDGMWRQHTWGVDADGVVVETTVPRDAYFGFRLSEEIAAHWARAQID